MPRLRLRIHPTGHVEVEVEGMGEGCHALVEEAASGVGVILERRPWPPGPGRAVDVSGSPAGRAEASAIRIGGAPSAG
jgi:hypothetical protein